MELFSRKQLTIKSRQLFSQKSLIVDIRLGSKHVFDLTYLSNKVYFKCYKVD